MTRHTLRIPWAGPAVALALLFAAVTPQPAQATSAAATAPAGSSCVTEAVAYGQAYGQWVSAFINYNNVVNNPNSSGSQIMQSLDRLNTATDRVVTTGVNLLRCLVNYL